MEIPVGEISVNPRRFKELPIAVQVVCNSLLAGLKTILDDDLHGVYLYGAAVFPETRYIQDIDLHIVMKKPLTVDEQEEIRQLHQVLADKYSQVVGDELDAWYILLDDAQKASPPRHQLYPDKSDGSWALHYAHMRAGFCINLFGPSPNQVFPEPVWPELVRGLEFEREYIERHLHEYPEYCVLNLCRLMYSYQMKNVVVSKREASEWALEQLAAWRNLIEAALRMYEREASPGDKQLLESEIGRFYEFTREIIEESSSV